MNPYLNRVMLEHPDQFFGRRRELRHILSRVAASRPQCVSVVGERRIGKSSLLNSLTWKEMQAEYLGDLSPPVFVAVDFQRYPSMEPEGFFRILFDTVHETLSIPRMTGGDRFYESFLKLLDQFRSSGKSLILLLDEFDVVTANSAFGAEFFSFMRSAANNYPIAYVTSSKIELQRICHSSDIADSPFFNIFSNLYLQAFSREEAQLLIEVPSAREGVALERYAEDLIQLAGHFPFYLQIACSIYFDALADRPELEPDDEELTERFLEEAGPHFEYYWNHSDVATRRVLERLMLGGSVDPEDQYVCKRLTRDGYVRVVGSRECIFSQAFAEYLQKALRTPDSAPLTRTWDRSNGASLVGRNIHQYQVLEKAGEGGMGIVYAAQDTVLGRKVALKVCRSESEQMFRERTLQEARLAASLTHPSLITVFELFEYESQVIIVMEWVEGNTLRKLIETDGPLSCRRLLPLLVQVCDGLEAAHQKEIVHRDIKSSNLMVHAEDLIKIADFGLAKSRVLDPLGAGDLTAPGAILGTVEYMSPEQVLGENADHRCDLFSLGVVLFEGLTGQLPFHRESVPATLNAIVNDPPPSVALSQLSEAYWLDPLIEKLLAKYKEERYQTAAEVRNDLNRPSRER